MEPRSDINTAASDLPKTTLSDLFAGAILFAAAFFLPKFVSASFWDESIAFGIGTGYGLFLCLLPVNLLTLFYVKNSAKAVCPKEFILTVCQSAVLFSFLVDSSFIRTFFQLFLFIYITGALCILRSSSLSLSDCTYHYLIPQLQQIFLTPVKKVTLPVKSLTKNIHIKPNKKLTGIIAGCLLSLPVLLIVGALLVSGDAAFGRILSDIANSVSIFLESIYESLFFGNNSTGALFFCLVGAVILSPFAFSFFFCFRHRLHKDVDSKSPAYAKPGAFIPPSVATGFYAMICVLYVLYLFSQLSYFFGAFSGEIPFAVNMTLSEYARRGFFEMSAIALINLGLVSLGVLLIKRKEHGRISPLFKGFFTFLCLFTLLLIITAISKMALYITSMGLTNKRIIVCIADLLLSVIMICVIARLYKSDFPYMKIIIYTCVTVLSLYALVGDSALIASFNTNAYIKGYHSELDIEEIYYESLPLHSVKALRKVAEDEDDIFRLAAKYKIGQIVFEASEKETAEMLEMNTFRTLLASKSLSDFLFWQYAKSNKCFITESLSFFIETDM